MHSANEDGVDGKKILENNEFYSMEEGGMLEVKEEAVESFMVGDHNC
ncbi:13271_t:CDS:2 [Ambispora gerdemannii]|uniref:13271_t:CDS:1 n=1 Tax=Ambispora gerdemannii TaxID=144530 RepID=A0A9N9B7X4_9GLOM|nr:13271_t:CDS:2 [Ambispora gerdemannii]